jgi:serine/threonine protein kinase
MANNEHCPKCGARLAPGLLGETCPNCALEAAFEFRGPNANVPEAITQVGPFKLLEKIGEGGLGVVYMAEQKEPIRRRVAVKLIKPGMDSREVIARFEAERQALALMDHPNIARIFDAGTTDSGHPYFAMELVRGVRITDYCDRHNLSTRERLDLFITVAQAVQHAHQKGIIHRDLKPSNILVTVNDGVPVPKIIDFGIAKATQQPLTEKTLFTRFNQLLGTPAYMSPEQAELTSVDIDTRTDIYSLGVLLYELLTGHTPFEPGELFKAGLEQMLRTIRETEPARPSARLNTLTAADLTTVAKQRHTEPPKLLRSVRGDLDWIVMKCLEKDRSRRYEMANHLAADIVRHIEQKPVTARPPGAIYRTNRFIRRTRSKLIAVSAVVLALVIGLIVNERHQRNTSRLRAAKAETRRLLNESEMFLIQQALATTNLTDVEDLLFGLEQATHRSPTNAVLWHAKGVVLEKADRLADAYVAFSNAIELAPRSLATGKILTPALLSRSAVLRQMGRLTEAASDYRRAKGLPPATNLADYRNASKVSIEFGETNRESGLQLLSVVDGIHTAAQMDGQQCRLFRPKRGQVANYAYFAIDPTFKWYCGADLLVRIEYMGAGPGKFGVHYASRASSLVFKLKKSNQWEEPAEIRPNNIRFDGDLNGGADFRIWTQSQGLYLRRVSITRAASEVVMRLQLKEAARNSRVAVGPDAESHPMYWVSQATELDWTSEPGEAYELLSKALSIASNSEAFAELRSELLVHRSLLLRRMNRTAEAAADNLLGRQLPARDSRASPSLIDLSAFYNASFTELPGGSENHLSNLPVGVRSFADTEFDVRAVVHLVHPQKSDLPRSVEGIHVSRKCKRLHFLHSVAHAVKPELGLPVGRYVIRFTDDKTDVIELKLGLDLWDWWFDPRNRKATQRSTIAWTGNNETATKQGCMLQLFKSTWLNPRPNVSVQSIDYVSHFSGPAPFLIAITAEP